MRRRLLERYFVWSTAFSCLVWAAGPRAAFAADISDDFNAGSIGSDLNGTVTPVGGKTWASSNFVFASGGTVGNTAATSPSARVPFGSADFPSANRFAIQADLRLNTSATSWVGVGFSPTNAALNGNTGATVWMLFRMNGVFSLNGNNVSGLAADTAPNWINSASNTVIMQYDSDSRTVTASVNGVNILDAYPLSFSASISYAEIEGFQSGGFTNANDAQFDNFALTAATKAVLTIAQGPVTSTKNGNIYYLLSGSSWAEAEAKAVALGGHLASITDAADQSWVYATFSNGGTRNLWIGLSDTATEGTFTWTNGDALTYTNWAAGQPDNFNNNEDHAGMRASDGQWVDVVSDFGANTVQGVVEIKLGGSPIYTTFDVVPTTPSNATGPATWSDNTVVDFRGNGAGKWTQTNPEQFVYDAGTDIPSSELALDAAARDGKAFHAHRTLGGASYGPVWDVVNNAGSRLIDATKGGTFVARLRTSFASGTKGNILGMTQRNSPQQGTLQIGYGGAQNWLSDLTGNPNVDAASFTSNAQYHVIRGTVEIVDSTHRNVKIYYDEILKIDEPNQVVPVPGIGNAGATRDDFFFAIWNDQNPVSAGPVGDLWIDWWAGYEGQAVPPGVTHPLNSLVAILETPTTGTRCAMGLTPVAPQRLTLPVGATSSLTETIANSGAATFSYTASQVDAFGNPANYPWMSFPSPGGGPVSVGGSSSFTVNLSAIGLAPGVYTGLVKFTNDCSPALSQVATIELTVVACSYTVSGGLNVWGCGSPSQYNLVLTNTSGAATTSFVITEVLTIAGTSTTDWPWLTINTPSIGPLGPGQSQNIGVTINATGQQVGFIRIAPTDCGAAAQVREIDVGYHSGGYVGTAFNNNPTLSKIYEYDGNTDPLTAGSCSLPGDVNPSNIGNCSFFNPTNADFTGNDITTGFVANDPDAVDGKAWHINNTAATSSMAAYRTIIEDNSISAQNVSDGLLGHTLVARIKVVSNTTTTVSFLNLNERTSPTGQAFAGLGFGGAGPSLTDQVKESFRGATSGTLGINDGQYHIFRMICGAGPYGSRTVKIFVDENPVPAVTISNAVAATIQASDGFGFGVRNGKADVYFDWITYTNAGMYEPGQEVSCLGTSLVPQGACCSASLPGGCGLKLAAGCAAVNGVFKGKGTTCQANTCCPTPFADANQDGHVDLNDFGVFQRCYTGLRGSPIPALGIDCFCFDRNSDGDISQSDLDAFKNCVNDGLHGAGTLPNPACN